MALFSRRVPVYVFLPVIVGCGAAGYAASTWRPEPVNKHSASSHTTTTAAQPSETSVVADTAAEPAKPQLAIASSPAQDIAPPAAVPIGEIDLLTPAEPVPRAAERRETDPDNARSASASVPTKASPRQQRAEPPGRTTSKARSQRTDRQRTAGPTAPPPNGLGGIPIIGPVFSLLQ